MKYFCPVLFALASSVFFGCAGSRVVSDVGINQLYPLAVGNVWYYRGTDYNPDGTFKSEHTDSLVVMNNEPVSGRVGYAVIQAGNRAIFSYSGYDFLVQGSANALASVFLRSPMKVGEEVVLRDSIYSGGIRDRGVLIFRGSDEPIIVPAGTFNCLHYDKIELNGPRTSMDTVYVMSQYFAPGIGYVQEKLLWFYNGVSKVARTSELVKYRVIK